MQIELFHGKLTITIYVCKQVNICYSHIQLFKNMCIHVDYSKKEKAKIKHANF